MAQTVLMPRASLGRARGQALDGGAARRLWPAILPRGQLWSAHLAVALRAKVMQRRLVALTLANCGP